MASHLSPKNVVPWLATKHAHGVCVEGEENTFVIGGATSVSNYSDVGDIAASLVTAKCLAIPLVKVESPVGNCGFPLKSAVRPPKVAG